jgi:hypothetical protein
MKPDVSDVTRMVSESAPDEEVKRAVRYMIGYEIGAGTWPFNDAKDEWMKDDPDFLMGLEDGKSSRTSQA